MYREIRETRHIQLCGGLEGRVHGGVYEKMCSLTPCGAAAKCLVMALGAASLSRASVWAELDMSGGESEDKSDPTWRLCFRISPWNPSGISERCFISSSQIWGSFLFWPTLTWNLTRILGNRGPGFKPGDNRVIDHTMFSDLQRHSYWSSMCSLSPLHFPRYAEPTLISTSSPPSKLILRASLVAQW